MVKLFCERFRQLRTEKNLSQAKLGVIFNVAQQTIDKWERGLAEPSMEMTIRLALFFDVTADYLLGLSNDIAKYEQQERNSISNNGHIVLSSSNRIKSKK